MHPVWLALLLILSLDPSTSAHAQTLRAERPTLTVGEKWIRSDGAYELVRIESGTYVFAAGSGREVHLNHDLHIVRTRRGADIVEWDAVPRIDWPLAVGKSGLARGYFRSPTTPSGGAPVTHSYKVEGVETLTIAGRFLETLKIGFTFFNERNQRRTEYFLWYAPDVRQYVRQEGGPGAAWKVVAFDRQGPAPLTIALAAPADDERSGTPDLTVRGKITGGTGLTRMTVTVNGVQTFADQSRPGVGGGFALEVPVKLKEGRNVVLVTAADEAGATRQVPRVIHYDKPAPVAASAPRRAATPPVATPPAVTAAPPPAAAAPPLQIALTSPRDQSRAAQEQITLAGVASGGRGVARVVVTLNGVEVGRMADATPQPAVAVNLAITLREGVNTLVVTAVDAAGSLQQEIRTVEFEKRVPLKVVVQYPENRARVTQDASVVAALVTSSKGVAKVSVTLNGTEVSQQTERVPQKSLVVSVPLTLRPGANAIVVSATEADGTSRQEIRTITYDPPKVAATPPPPTEPVLPTRNQWAVVIGVGRYENRAIPSLRYTVADAEAIYQTLIGPAGFKKDHVLLLTDTSERKPTLRNIKWALGTFLGRSAQKDDTVLIFFAGHGAPEVDTRGLERDGLAKYLIPGDADPDDLYSTALPMDELQTIFQRIESERVVAFLDACYSGAAGGRTFASKKTRAGAVDDLFLERLTRSKGRAIITASRPAEVSIELPELGHGIFTYYLVQALKGAGDLNRDGIVTLQEVYEYVEQQVTTKARAVGGNQHPVMKGELEGVLPLVKVRGR